MGIPWLESVSRKERVRREEKARQMMFPFGREQRREELRLLRGLVSTRAQDSDLLYQLFSAKAALRPIEGDEDGAEQRAALKEWLNSHLARGFTPGERAMFWALAELEQSAQSLEDLPASEAIQRRAGELMDQYSGWLRK